MKADLSIIVTNYNKSPQQLDECMNSIKEQTVAPKEIILVDDHSKEPHAHAMATSIILPKNIGVSAARSVGVKMSSGRLLLFVDADDQLAPDFIQQCGKVIAKADVAYTNHILFGQIEQNKLIETPAKLFPEHLLGRNCSIRVTSMMHRYVYDKLGGFRDLPIFEDWDFWVRAMCNGYTFAKANTLLYYRMGSGTRSRISMDVKRSVHSKITNPYEIKDGRIVERKSDGR